MFLPSPTGPPLKIAIVRSSSIGDVVLATACLELLRQLAIQAEIYWIGRNPTLELIKKAYPAVITLPVVNTPMAALAGVHFMIDLQRNLRSRILAAGFSRKYGRPVYACPKFGWKRSKMILHARTFGRRRSMPLEYMIAAQSQARSMAETLQRALAEQMPGDWLDQVPRLVFRPYLPTSHDEGKATWQKELRYGCWLAIGAGASYDTKRAPRRVFVKAINRIKELLRQRLGDSHAPLGLVMVGGADDRKRSLAILDELGWSDPVLNLAGQLSLWETSLALKEAACLLSNDSSLVHLAEAVDTPAAVLFGPTAEAFGFAPILAKSRSFSQALGCRPCSKHGKTPCRYGDQLCFTALPVDELAKYVVGLLGSDERLRQAKGLAPPDPTLRNEV